MSVAAGSIASTASATLDSSIESRPPAPFGAVLTAMVSPFRADGTVDLDGAAALADHLVTLGNDGLVVNGTTGESPTTSDAEKRELVRVVAAAVGQRATVIAGCGTNNTAHSIELARQAADAGAVGLLAVTPYYSKPPQAGVLAHFRALADAVDLPLMLYDIPGRSATTLEDDTLRRLSEHPRICAVKDARGDLEAVVRIMRETDLLWYSGDDGLNLPFLSIGATGFVSVTGHLVADRLALLRTAFLAGEVEEARKINESLQPVSTGVFRTQGVIMAKAALNQLGLPAGPVRLPLVEATPAQILTLRRDMADGGVAGFDL